MFPMIANGIFLCSVLIGTTIAMYGTNKLYLNLNLRIDIELQLMQNWKNLLTNAKLKNIFWLIRLPMLRLKDEKEDFLTWTFSMTSLAGWRSPLKKARPPSTFSSDQCLASAWLWPRVSYLKSFKTITVSVWNPN